ncbi:MAG TPA: FliH/SctL family protein [Pantanalinema sp.]
MSGKIIKRDQTRWIDGKWVVSVPEPENVPAEDVEAAPAIDPAELLAEAERRAQALLAAAEAEANDLIERVTRAAYEDGLAQGRDDGFQEGLAAWQQGIEAVRAAAEAFNAEREARLGELEPDLMRLGLIVASKVLLKEPRDAALVKGLVDAAVAKVAGEAVVRVRLNPQDAGHLGPPPPSPFGASKPQPAPKFEVVADPLVGAGGCVVETKTGRVDATFATQFEELARAVLDAEPEAEPSLSGTFQDLRKAPPAPPAKSGKASPFGGGGFSPQGFGR